MNKIADAMIKWFGEMWRYKIIYFVGLFGHILFAAIFGIMKIYILVAVDMVSVIIYAIALTIKPRTLAKRIWMIIIYFGLIIRCMICNFVLGWSCGFSMYSIMLIPLIYVMIYMEKSRRSPIKTATVMSALNIVIVIIARYYCYLHTPMYRLTSVQMASFANLNMFIVDFVLLVFSIMVVVEIRNNTMILRKKNRWLSVMANYDMLTGLRNRQSMHDIFEQYIDNEREYSIILGDIDDFKKVNDTYGHAAGDLVLQAVAEAIKTTLGEQGIASRWGGEEILILYHGGKEDCIQMNEQIRQAIETTGVDYEGQKIQVTMSSGICGCYEADSIKQLVKMADERMYQAKAQGKNRVVFAGRV